MGLLRRSPRAELSAAILTALGLTSGERALAFAVDDHSGDHVVATNFALAVVSTSHQTAAAGSSSGQAQAVQRTLRRPWLFVDAGSWEPQTATLTVTWTDGRRAVQWSFADQPTRLPETLRERVQASVVIATPLKLGDRRTGRVAIRQDFETRELIQQTMLGRYTRADDPEVQAHVKAALAHLRDQVGLPA